jgi:hypothetical protein
MAIYFRLYYINELIQVILLVKTACIVKVEAIAFSEGGSPFRSYYGAIVKSDRQPFLRLKVHCAIAIVKNGRKDADHRCAENRRKLL